MTTLRALFEPEPRRTLTSVDPRDDRVLLEVPVRTATEVASAVTASRSAGTWWWALGARERRDRLDHWRRILVSRSDELAGVISEETGKPLADAHIEVVLAIDHLHWAAKHARRVLRQRRVNPGMLMFNHDASIEYLPLGVVGVIGPWNYPVFTPMGAVSYALAAGNSVLFKPSEYTPAVGEWLCDSFRDAVPEAPVLELVTGDGGTGAALCRSGVDKIAFIGSAATGKRVMAACAETLTPAVIECGGKDAVLVDFDADLDHAAEATVWGGFSNAGQTCVGVERVYVHEEVADRFIEKVVAKARTLRAGGDSGADLGPITTTSQLPTIERHIREGINAGGRALLGGTGSVRPPFVDPVVLVDVPEDCCAVTEETFGPVIVINRVTSMDEAVTKTNDTAYGLGATVFSRHRGAELARRLRVGMVGINSVVPFVAMPTLPFGGVGESGFGRIHGDDGLREFSRPQSRARKRTPGLLKPTSFQRPRYTIWALRHLAKLLYGR